MTDLVRLTAVSLDASADVADALLDDVAMDDVLFHDLFYGLSDAEIAAAAELRAKVRQYACPWWRVEGSKVVGRIGALIVEVFDLEAVSKPKPDAGVVFRSQQTAVLFAEPGRLAEFLHSLADHVAQRSDGEGSARPAWQHQREIVTDPERMLSLRELADLIGRSKRWLEERIVDTDHPLPVYRFSKGKLSVKISEFQRWASEYHQVGSPDVARVVADVMSSLKGKAK